MPDDIRRVVALGASNLTRGLQTVVSTARAAWCPDVEVLGALGHGRSYGVPSRFAVRTLPGILESGLWDTLSSLPTAPTRGLVTDVGNEILYGFPAAQIVAWVEGAVDRLQRVTPDIVLTDLPVANVRQLSPTAFLLFRSIFAPQCRLPLARVVDTSEQVNDRLASLAAARSLRFVRMLPEWYGVDPIHMRPGQWESAWQHILGYEGGGHSRDGAWPEGLRLYFRPPERQWLFGVERHSPQSGAALRRGGRVWLF